MKENFKKNDLVTLEITDLGSSGEGIGKVDGFTLFVKDAVIGDTVQAGDLIGFMGRTGYSDKENTNNIETVHLHFGMQLILMAL